MRTMAVSFVVCLTLSLFLVYFVLFCFIIIGVYMFEIKIDKQIQKYIYQWVLWLSSSSSSILSF